MAAPTSYTESSLAAFMHGELSNVATALGWSAPGSYTGAVDEALLAYGASTVADATDIRKIRALARVQVWKSAAAATAADYDFDADGGRYDRSQVHEHCKSMLALVEAEAAPYSDMLAVSISPVVYPQDPYAPLTDGEEPVWP